VKPILLFLVIASLRSFALDAPAPATDPSSDDSQVGTASTAFLDIPWGAGAPDARTAMAKRTDVTFIRSSPTQLEYAGGKFAGIPVEIWRLNFAKGKFCSAGVSFEIPSSHVQGNWNGSDIIAGLKKLLSDKYGEPKSNQTSTHLTHIWSISTDPLSKDSETIDLYDNWDAHIVNLTYTSPYFQNIHGAAPAVDATDL